MIVLPLSERPEGQVQKKARAGKLEPFLVSEF